MQKCRIWVDEQKMLTKIRNRGYSCSIILGLDNFLSIIIAVTRKIDGTVDIVAAAYTAVDGIRLLRRPFHGNSQTCLIILIKVGQDQFVIQTLLFLFFIYKNPNFLCKLIPSLCCLH